MSSIYTEEYQIIIRKLCEARENCGLTQKEAAELIGKSQSYISKSESGERRLDIIELKHLAKIYKKKLDYFTGD